MSVHNQFGSLSSYPYTDLLNILENYFPQNKLSVLLFISSRERKKHVKKSVILPAACLPLSVTNPTNQDTGNYNLVSEVLKNVLHYLNSSSLFFTVCLCFLTSTLHVFYFHRQFNKQGRDQMLKFYFRLEQF